MAKIKQIYMDAKYSAIRYMIYTLYVFAALIIAVGLYFAYSTYNEYNNTTGFIAVGSSLTIAFLLVLYAQLFQVFIDLEWNQRETNELLQQVIENMPEKKAP